MSHDIQLLWQTGEKDFDYLDKKINQNNIKLLPFIDDMSKAYYCADIVISRAGALAIEELKSLGKAMILIPFPMLLVTIKLKMQNHWSKKMLQFQYPKKK